MLLSPKVITGITSDCCDRHGEQKLKFGIKARIAKPPLAYQKDGHVNQIAQYDESEM